MKAQSLKLFFVSVFIAVTVSSFAPSANHNLADEVLAETNSFRQTKGLAALEMKDELNAIAQEHSENMAKGRTRFGHAGFEQRNGMALKRINAISTFAENV